MVSKTTLPKIADLVIKTADFELILYLVHQIITFIQYQIFIEGCILYIWYLFELILTIIKPARGDLLHLVKSCQIWRETDPPLLGTTTSGIII